MRPILIQALSFLMVILITYFFKSLGILEKSDGNVVSTLILNLTLPATIVLGFQSVTISRILLIMIALGIFMNLFLVFIGGSFWRNKKPNEQALMMFGQGGYNIGNFVIPFVQGFFPEAIPFIGSFDTGNALMLFGGNSILIDKMLGQVEKKPSLKDTISKLFQSPPFVTYLFMIILAVFNLSLPETLLSVLELFSSANSFLAMAMIGLFLEVDLPKSDFKKVAEILLTRYSFGIAFALFFYFVTPFPDTIRLALVILSLAPIATVSTINMIDYKNKEEISGFLSSVSILISLVLIITALSFII
ncbi:MAG: AEC family transporter [Atopostipes suicloacalis]|nr:AEC family transporter [Atopostipes suicloacalis]MDN6731143.1 AEC family transporter [Atopostipes suicloacalis]